MPEPIPDEHKVRHARRFIAHHPDAGIVHGVQFPSGRILADHPETGLMGFTSMEALTEGRDGEQADVTVTWADEEYTPPPPGSDRDALPPHIRAAIRPHMPPYVSTYEQAADGCEAAIADNPGLAAELREWADRMRASCRATRKQDMAPCAHPKHRRGQADSEEATNA